jgi:hypothetical protein
VGAGINVDNYIAKDSENRICFTSTVRTTIMSSVITSALVGDSVLATKGVFGNQECHLIIGNATESLLAGEVAYQSSEGYFSKASALANSTIGYGFVWLVVQDADANDKVLLMNDGVFTLGTWSLTAGLQWVSTTGTITSTYPASTGNQLVSIGSIINATTILFTNPNGFYMEHI